MLQLKIEKHERENQLDGEWCERECDREEDRKDRTEDRKAHHDRMNPFMMDFIGRSLPHKENDWNAPSTKKKTKS